MDGQTCVSQEQRDNENAIGLLFRRAFVCQVHAVIQDSLPARSERSLDVAAWLPNLRSQIPGRPVCC